MVRVGGYEYYEVVPIQLSLAILTSNATDLFIYSELITSYHFTRISNNNNNNSNNAFDITPNPCTTMF